MAKLGTITFNGSSTTFNVYPWGTKFKAFAAVYVITKRNKKSDGGYSHKEIYVGQTNDLSERFDNHHKATCFNSNGANAICVYTEDNQNIRLQIEKALIDKNDPVCNG